MKRLLLGGFVAMLAAVVLAMVSVCPSWAQDEKEPIHLQISSKLGVKTKVKVKSTGNPLTFPSLADRETPSLAVDCGHGLYISIPLRQVKHVANGEKESLVTLADGTVHKGHVRTIIVSDPELDDSESGSYPLAKAAGISNPDPSKPKAPDPERKQFVLKVAEKIPGKGLVYPPLRTFHVYHPALPGFPEPPPDGKFRFKMELDGKIFDVNPADFERIRVFKQEKEWRITVKAPEAQERTGKLDRANLVVSGGIAQSFYFETVSGSRIGLWFWDIDENQNHGFILERATGKEGLNPIEKK